MPFSVPLSVQGYYNYTWNDKIMKPRTRETRHGFLRRSMISIDSKYTDLVHVRELCDHKHKNSQCVQEKHRVLIICGVRGDKIPGKQNVGKRRMALTMKKENIKVPVLYLASHYSTLI